MVGFSTVERRDTLDIRFMHVSIVEILYVARYQNLIKLNS